MRKRSPTPAGLVILTSATSQQEIADRMGRTQAHVSQVLSGLRTPPATLIPAIRDLAGDEAADQVATILGIVENPT